MTLPSAATSLLACSGVKRMERNRSRSRSRSRGRSWGRKRKDKRTFELQKSEDTDEWRNTHIGEIPKSSIPSKVGDVFIPHCQAKKKKEKNRPPEIKTNISEAENDKRDAAPTKEVRVKSTKETASSSEDSVDHLVAYYVDQIPSLMNLCWHRLETTDGDKRIVHIPARICAVKRASQQAMIDDLGILKGGRFRVVATSELIRYSGSSSKPKWCSKYMKEYLEYLSQHHNANVVKEEERFLEKVLAAVKEKDQDERDNRNDQALETSDDSVYIHSKKKGTSIDVHATNHGTSIYMDVRDQPPKENASSGEDLFAAFPSAREETILNTNNRKDMAPSHTWMQKSAEKKKQDTHVTFDVDDESRTSVSPEKSIVAQVTEQLSQVQVNTPVDNSGLDAETWWIVLKGAKLTRGATALVNRCMRTYGWSESYATRVLMGYKQFCSWKQMFEDWDDASIAPPPPIRKMWQQHLLDSRNYQKDCMLLFGNVLQYNPNNVVDTILERERIENTKRIANVRFRGKECDKEVWNWDNDATTDFVKDMNIITEQKEMARCEAKPSLPETSLSHSSSTEDGVPQSMREALALVHQARMDLQSSQSRPNTLQISQSSSSDVSSVSATQPIRLRIIGNGKNGLRSASIFMDFSTVFKKVFEEYAAEYARRTGQQRVMIRFLTKDGRRIDESDSPKSLQLLNNDEIYVVQPESDRSSWI